MQLKRKMLKINEPKSLFRRFIDCFSKKKDKYLRIATNNNLSLKDKFEVVINPKLSKNFNFMIVNPNDQVKALREKYAFNFEELKRHIILRDATGETIGCGCILCQLRHAEFKNFERMRILSKETAKLKQILQQLKPYKDHVPYWDKVEVDNKVRIFDAQNTERKSKYTPRFSQNAKAHQDPKEYYRIDPFEDEVNERLPLFSVYLSNPTYLEKKILKINTQKNELEKKYEILKKGRISMAKRLIISG